MPEQNQIREDLTSNTSAELFRRTTYHLGFLRSLAHLFPKNRRLNGSEKLS